MAIEARVSAAARLLALLSRCRHLSRCPLILSALAPPPPSTALHLHAHSRGRQRQAATQDDGTGAAEGAAAERDAGPGHCCQGDDHLQICEGEGSGECVMEGMRVLCVWCVCWTCV